MVNNKFKHYINISENSYLDQINKPCREELEYDCGKKEALLKRLEVKKFLNQFGEGSN